jgi:hypothetical protein
MLLGVIRIKLNNINENIYIDFIKTDTSTVFDA